MTFDAETLRQLTLKFFEKFLSGYGRPFKEDDMKFLELALHNYGVLCIKEHEEVGKTPVEPNMYW